MSSIITRIVLRYLAAMLIARGFLMESEANFLIADPDIVALAEIGVGIGMASATEAWFWFSRKVGLNNDEPDEEKAA